MNTFAGSFTLKDTTAEITSTEFDIVSGGNGTFFCMGQTDLDSSKEVLDFLAAKFGEISKYDISITTEDELDIFTQDYFSDGVYECVSFEGVDVTFDMISERFEGVDEVCVVREAEESSRHKNRIIKVDFLY